MIPKTFQLAGHTWKVGYNPHLLNLGECLPAKAIIQLKGGDGQGDTQIEQTFYHELVHAILFTTGDNGPHDEKFVDGFAYLLQQYFLTAK